MGFNIHKVEYDCDCCDDAQMGCACGKKSCFVMVLYRTTDYWKLFHRVHDGEFMVVSSFTDGQIEALSKLFLEPGKHSPDDGVDVTKEWEEIKDKVFK